MFNTLTQQIEAEKGSHSIEYAAALYEYGNALLTKEELSPSNNLLAKETLAKDQSGDPAEAEVRESFLSTDIDDSNGKRNEHTSHKNTQI